MAEDPISVLIRSGFSRRQARSLAASVAAGGGGSDPGPGGPADALLLRYLPGNAEGVEISWTNRDTDGTQLVSFDANWIPWGTPLRLSGSAMSYDPDEGITYDNGGVYLNHVSIAFEAGSTSGMPSGFPSFSSIRRGKATHVNVDDSSYLIARVADPTVAQLPNVDLTWMAVQDAGDTNIAPYISGAMSPNPSRIRAAVYQSVRLLA